MGQLFEVIKLFLILFEYRVSISRVLWRQGINWLNYNQLGRYNTIQTIRKLFDSIANTHQSLEVSWGLLIKFIICSWSFTLRSPFSPFSILPENKITIDSDCFRLFINNIASSPVESVWPDILRVLPPGHQTRQSYPPLGSGGDVGTSWHPVSVNKNNSLTVNTHQSRRHRRRPALSCPWSPDNVTGVRMSGMSQDVTPCHWFMSQLQPLRMTQTLKNRGPSWIKQYNGKHINPKHFSKGREFVLFIIYIRS